MTDEELVRAACQVIWTDGEGDRVGEFYADDFRADYPITNWGEGLAGVRALAMEVRKGFPDYREQIDELYRDGNVVIVKLTIRGTHTGPMPNLPPTGKAVEFRDVTICEIENGKIVKQSGLSDYLTMLHQLGAAELPG